MWHKLFSAFLQSSSVKFRVASAMGTRLSRRTGGGKSLRAEAAPAAGDVTALATECLSEAGSACTCINLGKGENSARREEGGGGRWWWWGWRGGIESRLPLTFFSLRILLWHPHAHNRQLCMVTTSQSFTASGSWIYGLHCIRLYGILLYYKCI